MDRIAGAQILTPHFSIIPNIVLRNLNFNRSFEMLTVSQIWLNVYILYISAHSLPACNAYILYNLTSLSNTSLLPSSSSSPLLIWNYLTP